jgi:hypothetical protein
MSGGSTTTVGSLSGGFLLKVEKIKHNLNCKEMKAKVTKDCLVKNTKNSSMTYKI